MIHVLQGPVVGYVDSVSHSRWAKEICEVSCQSSHGLFSATVNFPHYKEGRCKTQMCQLLQEYADPWIFPFFQVILQFLKPEIKSASFVTTGLMESALAALLSVEHALLKHHSNIDSRHRALLMGHHPAKPVAKKRNKKQNKTNNKYPVTIQRS